MLNFTNRGADILMVLFERMFGGLGAQSGDSADRALERTLLVSTTGRFLIIGIVWGLVYIAFGEILPGLIALGYTIISLVSLLFFMRTHRYEIFRFSQLALILVVPFLLMISLGGWINGSAAVIWSILSPLGALVFGKVRQSFNWWLGFAVLAIVSGFLQPYVRPVNNLPPIAINVLLVFNVLICSAFIFSMLVYFVRQREAALELLHIEREKSENLLLNVLPKEIAAILKDDSRTIAQSFESVSILFADVVNFTPMSAALSATEVVNVLNEVFSYFDSLAEKYDLEKIKTIGDCYMVAAGVPNPRVDHAQAVAHMALDMRHYICRHPALGDNLHLDFRIGIHSGPVVAGVIGRKKFIYDLWGDSVNTASRMESHGTPGKIHITQETYALLRDEFTCEPRGKVMVKGKGEMETWFLTGIREPVTEITPNENILL